MQGDARVGVRIRGHVRLRVRLRVVEAHDLDDEKLLAPVACDELFFAVVAQALCSALCHLGWR
jgi:hypothetical protein